MVPLTKCFLVPFRAWQTIFYFDTVHNIYFIIFVNYSVAVNLPSQKGFCTITGFFPIHSPVVEKGAMKCGPINLQDGIVFVEAFRYAITVTNNMGILPKNFSIGYNIYNTCKSTAVLKSYLFPTIFKESRKLLGIIGPYTSRGAALAASVFSIFHTTAVSYMASSLELEDRGRYKNFFRTVPSDRYEAEAMAEILSSYNWSYISCISSHEKQHGFLVLKSLIERSRKCIAKQVLLPEIAEMKNYDEAIDRISSNAKAKVIVLFTTREDTVNVLKAAKRKGYGGGNLWLGGTGWGNLMLSHELGPLGDGAISLNYRSSTHDEKFKEYFCSLNPMENSYVLFRQFWEEVFSCAFNGDYSKRPCTGKEKLAVGKGYPRFTSVGPVLDAVFIYAQALKTSLEKTCAGKMDHACFKVHYEGNILNWIRSSLSVDRFKSFSGEYNVEFDSTGGVDGKFDVMNLQWMDGRYEYKVVGTWLGRRKGGRRLMLDRAIHWPNGSKDGIRSECSMGCRSDKGEVRQPTLTVKGTICCWDCGTCGPREIVGANETCSPCDYGYKPDESRARCNKLREDHISFNHPVGKIAISLSTLGISLTTFVTCAFIYHNKTPIVKASGRELSYTMLLGIYICFASAVIFLCPPSKIICGIQRFIAGLSLNLCYASLLLKTNRLYRIFKNATLSVAKPSLTSPISQVTVVLAITSIQVLLGVVWSIGEPPTVYRHYPTGENYMMLYCNTDAYIMSVNLCVCLVLMLACTWFAFKTRNFPKNFNESKSTMSTMYASCFAWGVFLPIFILSENKDNYARTYTIVMFCDVIAYVTLTGLFGPKLRLILWPGKVTDTSSSGTVARNEVKTLKRNTMMSRAIISAYPAVTSHCVDPIDDTSQYEGCDASNQRTSSGNLHL